MNVLVSDTSVLIDLERGELLSQVFRLDFDFAVPDLLYERELKEYGGPDLLGLGLRIEELDGNAVSLAMSYRRDDPTLSLPDSFALSLAKTNSWTLLSGDARLRQLAKEEDVACHGVLWLLDQVQAQGIVDGDDLYVGLQKIAAHPRCRLPDSEIQKRLKIYQPTDPSDQPVSFKPS